MGQIGWPPLYTSMPCPDDASYAVPITPIDPCEAAFITFIQDPYENQSMYNWESNSMFATKLRNPPHRVSTRQLTHFRPQFIPHENEDEQKEEGNKEDKAKTREVDANYARSLGSQSSQARSLASSVREETVGVSRRSIPKAYTDRDMASCAGPSVPKFKAKGQRKKITIEQKRSNHIRHEKKRRELIRDGFNELTELVPGLRGGAWSRSKILYKATELLKTLLEKNEALQEQLNALKAGSLGRGNNSESWETDTI